MPGKNSDHWVATHSDPAYARQVLEGIYPDRCIRETALRWLASSILVAHNKNEQGWMVSLDPDGDGKRAACLNVGRVWAIDLYASHVKLLLLEAHLVPQTRAWLEGNNRLKAGQKGARGSRSLPLDFVELQSIEQRDETYASIIEAHHALIKHAIGSGATSRHRHHSSGLLEYMRQLGLVVPDPDYSSARSGTIQPSLFSDLSSRQEPEPMLGPEMEGSSNSTPLAVDLIEPNETKRALCTTYRILRDTALAREVKVLHEFCCQICGKALLFGDDQRYAEAHHIKPLGSDHDGPDVKENIICVCPNHHALLDLGAICLDMARLRTQPGHNVGVEYINYHNAKIFVKRQEHDA